jgi:sortase A
MALYRFVKEKPKVRIRAPKILSFLLLGSGFFLLLWTLWPILTFTLLDSINLEKTISPLSDGRGVAPSLLSRLAGSSDAQLTDVNKWFPTKPQKKSVLPVTLYHISIPKLNIDNAEVAIAGDDLSQHLIHYGGTPLPGQYGNGVIFGHSTLPQFYNPKNYKSIFSKLPQLENGDKVILVYDGITYTYTVESKIVVEPTDLSPLEQKFDDAYITLVTCVPPGTYWKRLNVKARLDASI